MRTVHFDGMAWPLGDGDLGWLLIYGNDVDLARVRRPAASVVSAYRKLLEMPQRERNRIISQIRKAAKVTP